MSAAKRRASFADLSEAEATMQPRRSGSSTIGGWDGETHFVQTYETVGDLCVKPSSIKFASRLHPRRSMVCLPIGNTKDTSCWASQAEVDIKALGKKGSPLRAASYTLRCRLFFLQFGVMCLDHIPAQFLAKEFRRCASPHLRTNDRARPYRRSIPRNRFCLLFSRL